MSIVGAGDERVAVPASNGGVVAFPGTPERAGLDGSVREAFICAGPDAVTLLSLTGSVTAPGPHATSEKQGRTIIVAMFRAAAKRVDVLINPAAGRLAIPAIKAIWLMPYAP